MTMRLVQFHSPLFSSICPLLLSAVMFAARVQSACPEPVLVDLTKKPSQEELMEKPRPFAGFRAGGVSGQRLPEPASFPFELTIMEINPTTIQRDGDVFIKLKMRNTSSAGYDLPASVDLIRTTKQGNLGRRDLAIRMRVLRPAQSEDLTLTYSAASESSVTSFQRVEAGCSALVLLKVNSNEILTSVPRASTELSFRITAKEIRYEDREWMIREISATVLSENREILRIGKR